MLISYFREHGIIHQTLCVVTPQQNSRVKRKYRHILHVSRAILFQASLPIIFWGEAVLITAFLINRSPSSIHNGLSPYKFIHNSKPNYVQLRVFGSACYVRRVSRDKDKFGERSRLCIFVGYPFPKKGWKLFDIGKNEFLVSRDVFFREDVFPFATTDTNPAHVSSAPLVVDEDWMVSTTNPDRGSSIVVFDNNTYSDSILAEDSVSKLDYVIEPNSVIEPDFVNEPNTASEPVSVSTPVEVSPIFDTPSTPNKGSVSGDNTVSTNVSPIVTTLDRNPQPLVGVESSVVEITPPRQGKRPIKQSI